MFTRFILRTAFPFSFNLAKNRVRTSNQYYIHTPSSTCTLQATALHRLYSQQVTNENMCVDFDYTKKATANNNILIVDVREPDELKEHGFIPNSINIPLGLIPTVLSEMSEKEFQQKFNRPKPTENTEIIFYCMIGKRSGKAQESAQKIGYKKAMNYVGSYTDWAEKIKS